MTKLGGHINGEGHRDGYGEYSEYATLVVAVDAGGALGEAEQNSNGRAVTIYRTTKPYLEAPGDINNKNPNVTWEQYGHYWYDGDAPTTLKEKWDQNNYQFKSITNEQGGGEYTTPEEKAELEQNLINLVNYERSVMLPANADGHKVCVLNLAGGSPGDFELWKKHCAPFIIEAWKAGNVYGRHVYGTESFVDSNGFILPGQPSRPIEELNYLLDQGYRGGLAITECGLDGGYAPADDHFFNQMIAYEKALRDFDDIVGIAKWTLGFWQEGGTNWQNLTGDFSIYMFNNPTDGWTPPDPGVGNGNGDCIPIHTGNHKAVILAVPQIFESSDAEYGNYGAYSFDHFGRTFAASVDDVLRIISGGDDSSFVIVADPDRPSQQSMIQALIERCYNYETVYIHDTPLQTEFLYDVWPTTVKRITQEFGENPENYERFGLPGHEGIDIASPHGSPYFAPKAGTITKASNLKSNGTPSLYGWHVIIDHGDGHTTLMAHALPDLPVTVGQFVPAGQIVAYSGNSGNSFGAHCHLTLKEAGTQLPGWPPGYKDPWPHLSGLFWDTDPPQPPLEKGYLWGPSLEPRDESEIILALTEGNLNFRLEPNAGSHRIGIVPIGTVVMMEEPFNAIGYNLCWVSISDIVNYNPPAQGTAVDIFSFQKADPRAFRVVKQIDENGNERGEDIQDMDLGDGVFVRRKNQNGEWWRLGELIHDTSPAPDSQGNERVYTLYKFGQPGAPKNPQFLMLNELWSETGVHEVVFRAKDDCRFLQENSGEHKNTAVLTRYEANGYVFNRFGQDLYVDEAIWLQTGGETQIYCKLQGVSLGWCGWSAFGFHTEPVEFHFDRAPMTQEPKRYCPIE